MITCGIQGCHIFRHKYGKYNCSTQQVQTCLFTFAQIVTGYKWHHTYNRQGMHKYKPTLRLQPLKAKMDGSTIPNWRVLGLLSRSAMCKDIGKHTSKMRASAISSYESNMPCRGTATWQLCQEPEQRNKQNQRESHDRKQHATCYTKTGA